jgi:energy-coupling factor transporter ATP-binding protein EcfA2
MSIFCGICFIGTFFPDKRIQQRAQLLFNKKYISDSPYKSIRYEDVNDIKHTMTRNKTFDHKWFTVVIGPTGIGKTTVVKTAADGLPGVIIIQIEPDPSMDKIVASVYSEIIGTPENNKELAKYIIKAFKTLSGGPVPCVIIQVDAKEEPDHLIDTARFLTEELNLNVVIDASYADTVKDWYDIHYSLTRCYIVVIQPMTDEMMRVLPQFTELFKYLDDMTYDQMVLDLCNGNPGLLGYLNAKFEKCAAKDKGAVVRHFVEKVLTEKSASIKALIELSDRLCEV